MGGGREERLEEGGRRDGSREGEEIYHPVVEMVGEVRGEKGRE